MVFDRYYLVASPKRITVSCGQPQIQVSPLSSVPSLTLDVIYRFNFFFLISFLLLVILLLLPIHFNVTQFVVIFLCIFFLV